jgi:OPA family glycerol-3-phosphate transporter-like MFS transporter
LGGGLVGVIAAWCAFHFGWPSAFYVPGALATLGAIYLFWRMRDSPESIGLPPIEEYRNEYPPDEKAGTAQAQLSLRHIFLTYILRNKALWLVAAANFFVYIARYSMLDWGPTYLKEKKGASIMEGGFSTLLIEFAGAGGMLVMGWVSDKVDGRRGMVSALSMIPAVGAFTAILFTPKGMLWLDLSLLALIGFLVYVPVMMLGVMALDLTSRNAVGTAAGFVGLFGYIGRVVQGKGIGWIAQHYSWNAALYAVLACSIAATILLLFTWNLRPRG